MQIQVIISLVFFRMTVGDHPILMLRDTVQRLYSNDLW